MENPESLSPDDADLERALQTLKPLRQEFTAQQIAFRAGFMAGRRQIIGWRVFAAAALVVCACSFAGRLGTRTARNDRTAMRAVSGSSYAKSSDVSPDIAASYLQLRAAIIRDGWAALPSASGGGNPQPSLGVFSIQ